VLTQPLLPSDAKDPRFAGKATYIMQNYITFLESAGARVVPIIYKGDHATEMAKLDKVNGILYAGGEDDFDYW